MTLGVPRSRPSSGGVGAHLFKTASTATRLVAIEVKSGPRRADKHGIDAFSSRFGPARTLIAGEGGIPLNEFLSAPAGHWLDEP